MTISWEDLFRLVTKQDVVDYIVLFPRFRLLFLFTLIIMVVGGVAGGARSSVKVYSII